MLLSPAMYRWTNRFQKWTLRLQAGESGWVRKLPMPAAGWTQIRDMPAPAPKTFLELWKKRK
jgi:L-lactate dehydrogenase complex protein LldF